ncbi:MAG: DUF2064 domain-containing protein [Saprospiraceae bacterium]
MSGLPLIKSTEATQRGDTFGRRIANAVNDCWTEGFDKLIIVGGDSPELSVADLSSARKALDAGSPTIGKDFRGGSFLIGLSKDSFRQNQFAELPWQTCRIACALKEELGLFCQGDEADVYELSSRADCNSQHDLAKLAERSVDETLTALLLKSSRRICDGNARLVLVSCFGESPTLRGPPRKLAQAA